MANQLNDYAYKKKSISKDISGIINSNIIL